MNSTQIQKALWQELRVPNQLVMPNYTPRNWWECDVMAVTKAGYWSEYEIKISVSDFKADAKKEARNSTRWDSKQRKFVDVGTRSKHQALSMASEHGPSFFWFVVPASIEAKIEVPLWAGLKVAEVREAYTHDRTGTQYPELVSLTIKKDAPRLHRHKLDSQIIEHARGVCYWRYWNLRDDLEKSVSRELKRAQNALA